MDIDYSNKNGTINSLHFMFELDQLKWLINNSSQINFNYQEGLHLKYQDLTWSWKERFDFLESSLELKITNLHSQFDREKKEFSFILDYFFNETQKLKTELKKVEIKCNKTKNRVDLIESCLKKMFFRVKNFDQIEKEKSEIKKTQDKDDYDLKHISNFSLDINNNQYELNGKLENTLPTYLKSKGQIQHDNAQSFFYFNVEYFKANGVNITDYVFNELKKHQSAKFKVSKPYLFFYYNN